ncbi:MAG TPA: leucine--tRNA ligase [Armatimonadota bacterium]|nr:leucine--tRNA ligase [Armatimonadota bacterium]
MRHTYRPSEIEPKWQQRWRDTALFRTSDDASRPKFYYLDMFPYPSGDLHVGHVRNYALGDCVARQKVMRGYRVLHPMGWDAFGLPAENAALERGVDPRQWTERCIAEMRRQFDQLGISYDWDREVAACRPEYYRWTQWVFVQLFRAGLAYRKEAPVNFCPKCSTVLANEQVKDGRCERCDSVVGQRNMEQWFFRTTAFADRLLDDLALLDRWPERVRTMQRNWIGRSQGVEIDFVIEPVGETITVFTTRVDTIFGATFVALAAEHPMAARLASGTPREAEVLAFIDAVRNEHATTRGGEEADKVGVFTGGYAINPMNGERLPVWIANYILTGYGTGAIMAVPAHDQRDLEFARKYDLPVRVVIQPEGDALDAETMTEAYVGEGTQVNSGQFDGLPSEQGKEAIADYMESQGFGRRAVNYRLHDWCISRQRYWGAPIPIIYCEEHGPVAVPESDLPVLLPEDADLRESGRSPLASSPAFVNAPCPKCGKPGRREVDTMDTFVDSSWYFLRFASPHEETVPFDRAAVDYWLPVDQYVGGVEHAVLHLYYARFVTKALHDLGYLSFVEPFAELFTQGMIVKDGAKMSKSRGNVVRPDAIIDKYGADALRLFILFAGPPDQDAEWSDEGVAGCFRFLSRAFSAVANHTDAYDPEWRHALASAEFSPAAAAIRRKLHQTIAKVTSEIEERFHFNTAIAALMEYVNDLTPFLEGGLDGIQERIVFSEAADTLTLLLSPFAPHLADELWERLGHEGSTYSQAWIDADPEVAREESIEIPVQVNGKVRGRVVVPVDAAEDEVKRLALELDRVRAQLEGKQVRKVIVAAGRLVSIVAS